MSNPFSRDRDEGGGKLSAYGFFKTTVTKTADVSPCRKYRYTLSRVWDEDMGLALWVMLNPSIADDKADDPTIRRVTQFTRDWGYGGLLVGNLFALRATFPAELFKEPAPVGPNNDAHLVQMAQRVSLIMVAWGTWGEYMGRDFEVLKLLSRFDHKIMCLGTNQGGSPKHPLYVPKLQKPSLYKLGK